MFCVLMDVGGGGGGGVGHSGNAQLIFFMKTVRVNLVFTFLSHSQKFLHFVTWF